MKIAVFTLFLLVTSFITSACFADKENKWSWYKDNRELKSNCIEAEGEWSYGSHILNRTELNSGEIINYDVKISCRGRFEINFGLIPKETVSVIAGDDRRNRYVETIDLNDGTTQQRYLSPHNIYYSITLTSLIDPKRSMDIKEPWTVATSPRGMGGAIIHVPKDFTRGEPFRISVEIEAKPAFYEDYKWLGASIGIPTH